VTSAATIDVAALASRFRIAVVRLARTLRREADTGVTPSLYSALSTVEHHGPITISALADHEGVRKPTITRTVRALVDLGLVNRIPDPVDGRVAWLDLSPEGRRLLQRARRRTDEYLARRLKRLAPQDAASLQRAADIIERLLEEGR
jgi:DNA-binding MarR family transcriptional regulator